MEKVIREIGSSNGHLYFLHFFVMHNQEEVLAYK